MDINPELGFSHESLCMAGKRDHWPPAWHGCRKKPPGYYNRGTWLWTGRRWLPPTVPAIKHTIAEAILAKCSKKVQPSSAPDIKTRWFIIPAEQSEPVACFPNSFANWRFTKEKQWYYRFFFFIDALSLNVAQKTIIPNIDNVPRTTADVV